MLRLISSSQALTPSCPTAPLPRPPSLNPSLTPHNTHPTPTPHPPVLLSSVEQAVKGSIGVYGRGGGGWGGGGWKRGSGEGGRWEGITTGDELGGRYCWRRFVSSKQHAYARRVSKIMQTVILESRPVHYTHATSPPVLPAAEAAGTLVPKTSRAVFFLLGEIRLNARSLAEDSPFFFPSYSPAIASLYKYLGQRLAAPWSACTNNLRSGQVKWRSPIYTDPLCDNELKPGLSVKVISFEGHEAWLNAGFFSPRIAKKNKGEWHFLFKQREEEY